MTGLPATSVCGISDSQWCIAPPQAVGLTRSRWHVPAAPLSWNPEPFAQLGIPRTGKLCVLAFRRVCPAVHFLYSRSPSTIKDGDAGLFWHVVLDHRTPLQDCLNLAAVRKSTDHVSFAAPSVLSEVAADGLFEREGAAVRTALDLVVGEEREPAFDQTGR